MQYLNCLIIYVVISVNLCWAQDKWVWSKARKNDKVRGYYPSADKRVYNTEEQYARVDREREPTTKRPIPGQPQNDDIDDYNDANDEGIKQNSPYLPNAGYPRFGGNFNSFGNYPEVGGYPGNAANGILIGPGGPTGIIGRPANQYPGGVAPSPFPSLGQAPYPGFAGGQNFPGATVNGSPGYPNYNSLYNGFGQYPGQQATYPNTQQFGGAQYPHVQYPQAQYPASQFPQQPQYTEGYGLSNLNTNFNVNPAFNSNLNPNYGFGFDEYPTQFEGKSAPVKAIDKKVDDKVAKNLKKL